MVAVCGAMRAAGIRIGMSVARAVEIGRPGLIECHDPEADAEALGQIAGHVANRISPLVAIEALDPVPWAGHWRHQSESLLVDVSGVCHLWQNPQTRPTDHPEPDADARKPCHESMLCGEVLKICASMHLRCRLAMADTPAVAWGAAHYQNVFSHARQTDDKPRRNAAGESPTESITESITERALILPHGHGIAAIIGGASLLDMPVEALRIAESTTQTLSRLGVTTVGQCLRLPRDGLVSRLGRDLIRRIDQWTGDRHESITIHDLPAQNEATWDLQYPTNDRTIIADRMRRVVKKVSGGLANDGRGALRLAVRMDLTDQPPLTYDVGLFAPSRDVEHLCDLLCAPLENDDLKMSLTSNVRRIGLSVIASATLRCEQNLLFEVGLAYDGQSPQRSWRGDPAVARLVDSLACRVGRGDVVEVLRSPDPVPESSFQTLPLTGNIDAAANQKNRPKRGRGRSKTAAAGRNSDPRLDHRPSARRERFGPQVADAMRRPLALLDRPLPLVVDGLCEKNVPPQTPTQIAQDDLLGPIPPRIRISGVFHRVTRGWGPERIESNWWKGKPLCREYYRVETERGLWLWIFRDADQKWFLHGRF